MVTGNSPYDGGNLILSVAERDELLSEFPQAHDIVKRLFGSGDYIGGQQRFCLWITDGNLQESLKIPAVASRIESVRLTREGGGDVARGLVKSPHKFRYTHMAHNYLIIVPRVSSERREYIPAGTLDSSSIVADSAQAIYDPPLWVFSIIVSKLHMAWVRTVSGKLKSDIRYASALCYNTFPLPALTDQNKADLTHCAENILLARESHFPATIADLYDPDEMPDDLRRAHEENDDVLERIYIGRRFRNDTERLEKLFDLYAKMTTAQPQTNKKKAKSAA